MTGPRFSILTPSYKRGMFLPYVWMSLCSQGFKDFEWLVGIDGENDDSVSILEILARQSSFPIKVIASDIHVGKSVIDNLLIESSRGDWVLWCDSDDFLLEDALAILQDSLCHAAVAVPSFYCVLGALSETLIPKRPSERIQHSVHVGVLGELFERHVKGDSLICVKGDRLRSERFPEVDFYCAEGVLWNNHLEDLSLYIESPVMYRKYLDDGISLRERIFYPRGKLLVMQHNLYLYNKSANKQNKSANKQNRSFFYFLLQIFRFAMHTQCTKGVFVEALRHRHVSAITLCVAAICALIVYLRDLLFDKVVYTHLDFDRNMRSYKITSSNWNWS